MNVWWYTAEIESPSVPVPTNLESTLDRETLSPSLSPSHRVCIWKFLVRYIVTGCIFCAPSGLRQGQVFTPSGTPYPVERWVPPPPPPPETLARWAGGICVLWGPVDCNSRLIGPNRKQKILKLILFKLVGHALTLWNAVLQCKFSPGFQLGIWEARATCPLNGYATARFSHFAVKDAQHIKHLGHDSPVHVGK